VRLTGGNDITPEVQSFMTRYKVQGYPTLYVMNTAGHVVVSKVGRSVEQMLQALADGEKSEAEFEALRAKSDAESAAKVRQMLADRMAWDDLLPLAEAAAAKDASEANLEEVVNAHRNRGDLAAERTALEKLMSAFPKSDKRGARRVRLATMEVEATPVKSREEFAKKMEAGIAKLQELLTQVQGEKDAVAESDVRLAIGNAYWSSGKPDDATPHFEAVIAAKPPARILAQALMGRANTAFVKQDLEVALAHLERIVAECPDTEEAKRAPVGIDRIRKMIEGRKGKEGATPPGPGK
jgi:tetratricopeptide (TPR) repeat protein